MGKYGQYSDAPEKTRATHGLTVADLDKLHADQKHEDVKTIPCNLNPDHKIAAVEAHAFYHVLMEAPLFDSANGKRLSTPKKRKFHIRQFHHMEDNNFFNGFTVEILHNPELYNEEKAKADQGPTAAKHPTTADGKAPTHEQEQDAAETTDPGTDATKADPEADDIPNIETNVE